MSKEIIVIVKNKLMSTDTVIPILVELKEKYDISSLIIVNDEVANKGINDNIVLRDAITFVGKKIYTGHSSSNKIVNKMTKIIWFVFLFYRLSIGTKVLHFGIFDCRPYSFLAKIFSYNLYFLQSDSFKHSYEKFDRLVGQNPVVNIPNSKNIVAFNDGMSHIGVLTNNHKLFMFGGTRTRYSWLNYIKKRSDNYFSDYHGDIDLSNGCVVLILSYFGFLPSKRNADSMEVLFKKTVEVLSGLCGNVPVLLKPHVFTDLEVVHKIIGEKKGFYITYLHPTVLATKAKVFICNSYSTTMADAKSMGVTTLEYSDYNLKVLEMSKGKSVGDEYIDNFINNDQRKFHDILHNILDAPYSSFLVREKAILDGSDVDNDSERLLTQLSQ